MTYSELYPLALGGYVCAGIAIVCGVLAVLESIRDCRKRLAARALLKVFIKSRYGALKAADLSPAQADDFVEWLKGIESETAR